MASASPNVSALFAVGTSLGAYPTANWSYHEKPPTGAPVGSATATASVAADGSVALTGLAADTRYYLTDSSGTRYVRFSTFSDVPAAQQTTVANNTPWASDSKLGSTKRAATDLLMSSYDTDASATDHTSLFRSALADAATLIEAGAAKVRIILDSRQTYTIGGAVTAGANGQWAQIPLPYSHTATGVIELVGLPRGGQDYSYIGIGGNSGTVIKSTLASAPAFDAARGIASIFGGPASFSTAHTSITSFSMIRFATQDITIRAATPVVAGIDAGYITGFGASGLLQFDTDQMAAIPGGFSFTFSSLNISTAPQAIPLITPLSLCWYGSLIDTLCVAGWVSGPVLGEMVHMNRYGCFAVPGAVLSPDGSTQPARINYLFDWMNGYGVAQMTAQSATPQSVSVTPCPASQRNGTLATAIEIGSWQVQTPAGGAASAVLPARTATVWDANEVCPVEGLFGGMTAGGTLLAVPTILGAGDSATGKSSRTRLRSRFSVTGRQVPSVPASGTAIRNPSGREALVNLSGGTVTSVTVDGATAVITASPGVFAVPPNGVVTLTYTVAPTWVWIKL